MQKHLQKRLEELHKVVATAAKTEEKQFLRQNARHGTDIYVEEQQVLQLRVSNAGVPKLDRLPDDDTRLLALCDTSRQALEIEIQDKCREDDDNYRRWG